MKKQPRQKNNKLWERFSATFLVVAILLVPLVFASYWNSWQDWNDDFNDGVINTTFWDTSTQEVSGGTTNLTEAGTGGNLQLQAQATSGSNRHATSLVTTDYDYNDGRNYLINLTAAVTDYSITSAATRSFVQVGVTNLTAASDYSTVETPVGSFPMFDPQKTISQEEYYLYLFANGSARMINSTGVVGTADLSNLNVWKVYFRSTAKTDGAATITTNLDINEYTSQEYYNVTLLNPMGTTLSGLVNYSARIDNITAIQYVDVLRNGVNVSRNLSGVTGIYSFLLPTDFGSHNYTFRVTDTLDNSYTEPAQSFTVGLNATVFNQEFSGVETEQKTLTMNTTYNDTVFTSATGTLYFNNSAQTTTSTTGANTANFTSTFDVPTVDGNRSMFWSITLTNATSSVNYNVSIADMNVSQIHMGICNASLTVPYVNFTFKNETTNQEDVSATIDTTWDVWLGSGSVKKTFTVSNNTELPSHAFCFTPADQTYNTDLTAAYSNGESQQRTFISEPILSNSTTSLTLYLLPTVAGLFSQFQTIDVANNPIALVKGVITRTLGGSTVTVTSGLTDSSGLVVMFLNPDVTYSATFSKTGFTDNTFTFVPVTDLRFVTMGTGATVNGSNISIGSSYEITPTNNSLRNDTTYTFGFNVTGTSGINFISMNITNSSGFQLAYQTGSGPGFISQALNTVSNTTFIGRFTVQTADETIVLTKLWRIGNEFEGDYSLSKQGNLVVGYQWADFVRYFIVIIILFAVVLFMSQNEVADNNESKVAVVVLLIWVFSAMGWLNNPAVSTTHALGQYAAQYGIAILSTFAAVAFFMRRVID